MGVGVTFSTVRNYNINMGMFFGGDLFCKRWYCNTEVKRWVR